VIAVVVGGSVAVVVAVVGLLWFVVGSAEVAVVAGVVEPAVVVWLGLAFCIVACVCVCRRAILLISIGILSDGDKNKPSEENNKSELK